MTMCGCGGAQDRTTSTTATAQAKTEAKPNSKSAGPASLLITNTTVINPATKLATKASVVVTNGRITAVTTALPTGWDGPRLDGTGKFLVPAFADMHVHAWGNPSPLDGPDHDCGVHETARFMLYCGVAAFLDLGSNEARIFGLRNQQRASGLIGADIYAAGAVIGTIANPKSQLRTTGEHSEDGLKRFRAAQSPQQARAHVRALAKFKADVVKVLYDHTGDYMNMPKATLTALVDEARRNKLKVVVHIGSWKDASDAVDAGADAITHLWDEDDIPAALIKRWLARGVLSIPTQPVQVDMPNVLAKPGLLAHPLLRAVTTPKLRADYRNRDKFVKKAKFWARYQGPNTANYERQLKTMSAAGIGMMSGSDSGNFGVFQGFSLHRELALMVRAGVTTWDTLKAATVTPGRFLGRKLGVDVGDEGSFVLLNGDPIADIGNTTKIAAVVQKGRVVDRAALLKGTSCDVPSASTR